MGGRRREPSQRIARAVLVGFGALALAFTAAMVTSVLLGRGIREAADAIATNGEPSVAQLGSVRTELRHLEIVLDDTVERRPAVRAEDLAAVAASRRAMADAWASYLALPTFQGERLLQPAVEHSLARVDLAVDEALGASDRAAADKALERTKVAADELDVAVARLRNFNAAESAAAAREIRRRWRQSVLAGVIAVGVVALIALFTALALGRAARQLAHATEERADELEAFAGRVAHDLVGPLTAAVMTLSLVSEDHPGDSALGRRLERLTSTLRRTTSLVHDLYEYAAAGGHPDRRARADVGEVLRDVVAQQATTRREAEIIVDQPLPASVACRPGVLCSIMTNLLDNAVKHIAGGQQPRIAVHVRHARDAVRIEVEDNGPGIPPERQQRLFEPYTRGETHAGGLGLGLATVKRLTESHGGVVGVRSTIGSGSTFWLELPKAAA